MAHTTSSRKATATPARVPSETATNRVYKKYLPQIQKRDGRIVPFDFDKIVSAIEKAMKASNEGSPEEAVVVGHKVAGEMMRIGKTYKNFLPTVEGCQDEVERQLMLSDYIATSKSYILYRAKRSEIRKEQGEVPEHVKKLAEESKPTQGKLCDGCTKKPWIKGKKKFCERCGFVAERSRPAHRQANRSAAPLTAQRRCR